MAGGNRRSRRNLRERTWIGKPFAGIELRTHWCQQAKRTTTTASYATGSPHAMLPESAGPHCSIVMVVSTNPKLRYMNIQWNMMKNTIKFIIFNLNNMT